MTRGKCGSAFALGSERDPDAARLSPARWQRAASSRCREHAIAAIVRVLQPNRSLHRCHDGVSVDAAPGTWPLFEPPIVKRTAVDSFVMLNPRTLAKNPVMFVVEVRAAACWSETARLWVPG